MVSKLYQNGYAFEYGLLQHWKLSNHLSKLSRNSVAETSLALSNSKGFKILNSRQLEKMLTSIALKVIVKPKTISTMNCNIIWTRDVQVC